MKEKLAEAGGKVKAFFGKLSGKTRVLLGVALAAVVVLIIAAVLFTSNKPYTPLFTGVSATEMSSILSFLDQGGITDYKVENNDTILVKTDQEPQLKAQLLMQGYPKSGFAYEIYLGNVGALSTDADRKTALLYDLQDRMSAVVRCMEGVKEAHVTIAQGADKTYVLDDNNVMKATASVIITMEEGRTLSTQQAAAVRNLVARAVQGLEMENITIADANGNSYSTGGTTGAVGDASALRITLEEQENNKARTAILQVLGPFYGEENVRVAVNCTVDVSRRVEESTKFYAPDNAADGQGIINSEIYKSEIIRDGDTATGGTVGTTANADIPQYVQDNMTVEGDEAYLGDSGEKNYSIDKTTGQVEYLAGTVTDMMVSVSINGTTAGSVDTQRLMDHIGTAARINADQRIAKISIMVQPFYQPGVVPDPDDIRQDIILPPWAIYAAIAGGVLFLILFILFVILGRKRRKKQKLMQQQAEAEIAGYAITTEAIQAAGADIMNVKTEKSMELRKDIRQFAESNPEIAAQLVKSWLRGGEDGNA